MQRKKLNRWVMLMSTLLLFVMALAISRSSPAHAQEDKIEPGLRETIENAPNGKGEFLVYMSEQADLGDAFGFEDRDERGEYVYDTLFNKAQSTQTDLLAYLNQQQSFDDVSEYRSFYIVNAVAVTGNVETLDALAARADVSYIEGVKEYSIPEPIPGEESSVNALEWGVEKIRADEVWADFGTKGEGIVVANIDTGVLHTHATLVNQYRGTTTGSHDYNWYDPSGTYPTQPGDNNGHGTHTMGTIAGDDGANNQIGVAPGAKWIAAKGCESSSCSNTSLLASAEWVLAPYPIGGNAEQGDPSKRPHLVNNSWGGGGGNTWYQASVQAWRAAGILPVFSAGNSGSSPGSIGSPGDYAESFAVGATDSNDNIASFSSRGPSSLTDETKPDVSAPGVSVRSAWNNGGYNSINGTSMAAPHVAGCAALLKSLDPSLTIDQIENLLTSTAVDLGASGPDYNFGYGRIDCRAAAESVDARGGDPYIEIDPESFEVTLLEGESTTKTLTIGNIGTDSLTFDIAVSSSSTPQLLDEPRTFDYIPVTGGEGTEAQNSLQSESTSQAYRFESSSTASSTASVLYFTGNSTPSERVGEQALANLDVSVTGYIRDESGFLADLSSGTWDLVLYESGGGSYDITPLVDYVADGGKLIVSYWKYDSTFAAGMEANYVDSFSTPLDVYPWQSHPIFTSPNAVPNLVAGSDDHWAINGHRFEPVGSAVALGGYTSSPTANEAAIILGNEERTILNGMIFEDFLPIDSDSDGKPDTIELVENEVMYLLDGSASGWLSATPTSGTVAPSGSTDIDVGIDATELTVGVYNGSLTINNNDPDENPVVVPVELTVTDDVPDIEVDPESFDVTLAEGDSTTEILSIGNTSTTAILTFDIAVSSSSTPQLLDEPRTFDYIPVTGGEGTEAENSLESESTSQAYRFESSSTTSSTASVLYFSDMPIADERVSEQALANLDVSVTGYINDYTGFLADLSSGSSDVVIYESGYNSRDITPLVNYVAAGGQLISSYWKYDTTFATGMETNYVGTFSAPRDVHQWQSHAIFTTPNAVPNLVAGPDDHFADNGDRFEPTGSAVALGGYTSTPTTNEAAIILGNEGRTILNGVIFEDFLPIDSDSDGKADIIELLENEVVYLLGGGTSGWLSASPTTGTVAAGDSTDIDVGIDATNLSEGVYTGALTINNNDPDENPTTVPVTLTVGTGRDRDFTVSLEEGWNLLSFPVELADTDVEDVLASIDGQYDIVYAYDQCGAGWKKFDPNGPPFANTLTDLDHSIGFWVNMTQASTLVVTGSTPDSTTMPVCSGWNLVGYPTPETRDLPDALDSISGEYVLVNAYKPPWQKFDPNGPPFANTLTDMQPGFGYWINATQDGELIIE